MLLLLTHQASVSALSFPVPAGAPVQPVQAMQRARSLGKRYWFNEWRYGYTERRHRALIRDFWEEFQQPMDLGKITATTDVFVFWEITLLQVTIIINHTPYGFLKKLAVSGLLIP